MNVFRNIFKFWKIITEFIGHVISLIILSLVYYLLFIPYALALKLFKVRLVKTFPKDIDSYWIDKPVPKPRNYERQF